MSDRTVKKTNVDNPSFYQGKERLFSSNKRTMEPEGGAKFKLMAGDELEYAPERVVNNPKNMGVAFHQVHKLEESSLSKMLMKISSNCRFLHKPSDQLNVLVSQDNKKSPIVFLALARDAFIVKPSFAYECFERKKVVSPLSHEVGYFPKKSERLKSMKTSLKDAKMSIDIFSRSSQHPFLGDPMLEYIIVEMGGKLVRRNTDADFIISDKLEKVAVSSIFKKVDYNWLLDSLLQNCLQPVQNYYF